ncbi:MAG: glycoside hydrolase family 3 N-terminal domain-containing protein [Lachnospiraceae bacterium]|nr:glycoside hydrolase family 3 N-terminal domain-containing protein [Lachnospiraceae bacterium]
MYNCEQEHLDILRGVLGDCAVLLRSDGSFPLEAPCKIAAYGSGVRYTVKGGTGSGEVNARYTVTVEQGLQEAGFTITTSAWLDQYDQIRREACHCFVAAVRTRAKQKKTLALIESMGAVMHEPEYNLPLDGDGDTALYVISRNSGENTDRQAVPGDILLTESEVRDINALQKKYTRFLLVLNVGGPVDLSRIDSVKNILLLSQLGTQTGTALADLILGHTYPSGHLTTTWADWSEYNHVGDFGDLNDTRYREGIYVGYRWFDSVDRRARFPFGYGLGYTEFSTSQISVTVNRTQVAVSAMVRNIGAKPGKEVVQVYVSVPSGKLDQPWQALTAFTKTKELSPSESQIVETEFSLTELAGYDTKRSAFILEPGEYIVRVGKNSIDTVPAAVLVLDREVTILHARPCGETPDFEDWKPEHSRPVGSLPVDLPRLSINADVFTQQNVKYNIPKSIAPEITALTDEQLATLTVGNFDSTLGTLSVIGTSSKSVAGAAGETTDILRHKNIPSLVMADGPAGLRLTPTFYRDEKGAHGLGQGGIPPSMVDFIPAPLRLLMRLMGGGDKPPKGKQLQYQYATALPIGTALAQSFDIGLAEQIGDLVGSEMERFGINLWLAPALNIHRDIRCGRNFEYFSEDPLISGMFAAALTRGVQRHPGCGVTIKHFAANNQETNRMNNNSIVSERAMREIYLRGFGICIRQSAPYAVMTSYNLLNGTHISERRDIIENILRCEFGFSGITMTDWMVRFNMSSKDSKYRKGDVALVAAAGGDLIMPGSKTDVKEILNGLHNGILTRQQLEQNASRIVTAARKLGR